MKRIALIGARGHTGAELLKILSTHDGFVLDALSSRKLAGQRAADHFPVKQDLQIESLQPTDVSNRDVDAWVLALPNGLSAPWVEAIRGAGDARIVDLSADHRFVDWTYGLPEHNREAILKANSIANPGCYATGMQVALRPLLPLIEDTPSVFGISGYSGAGTKPSENNDPEVLRDNLIPYKPVQHTHEKEVSRQLGRRVAFMPHVAPFFRGITLTITMHVKASTTLEDVYERLHQAYSGEPLVEVLQDAPRVRDNVGSHLVRVGGAHLDAENHRLVLVATLDNLLKGAATQAIQNLNLMAGFEELKGISL